MKPLLIDRSKLLTALEQVAPGLSVREIIDQSSCFIFKKGRVLTYNQEVFCSARTRIPEEIEGAVQADKLTGFLRKTKDEKLKISFEDNELVISSAKGKEEAHFPFQSQILLPYDDVEAASKWRRLHPDFVDAVGIVQQSASSDQSEQVASCVHITPKYIEATDSIQLCRYRIKTGVPEPFLVRKQSIKFITSLPITRIAVTDNSIHFKSDDGLIVSSRLYKDNFGNMSTFLKKEGESIILPGSLKDVMDKAQLFSSVDKDNNYAHFTISPEKIIVEAKSLAGSYKRTYKNPKYKGPKIQFKVKPELIQEVLRRHTDCEIIESSILKINGGKYTYMVALDSIKSGEK